MDLDFHMAKKRTDEYGITVYRHKGVIIGYTWTDEQGVFHLYRYPAVEVQAAQQAEKKTLKRLELARNLSVMLVILGQFVTVLYAPLGNLG